MRACLAAVIVGAAAATAFAHDFWIEPAKFRARVDEDVVIGLRNGVTFPGAPVARDDALIERFVVAGPEGTSDVRGADRTNPAGSVTGAKDGIYVLGYRGKRRYVELAAEKFEAYLKEEGLDAISKLRAERKHTKKAGREVFSRCAKALLKVGEGAKDGHDRRLGLTVEIVPETNPYLVAAGTECSFLLLRDGKPLADALVVARCRADADHPVSARTDKDGRVRLKLGAAGEWLVKSVVMTEAPADVNADWESIWASLTFELAAAKSR